MKLSNLITLLLIFVLAFTGFNCKSSEDPNDQIDPSSLVGTWVADGDHPGTEFFFEEPVSGLIIDVINQAAGSINVTLEPDYDYTLTIAGIEDDPIVETGKATFNGDKVTMTPDILPEDAITFTYSLANNLLNLYTEDSEIPDTDIPANLTLALQKVSD